MFLEEQENGGILCGLCFSDLSCKALLHPKLKSRTACSKRVS